MPHKISFDETVGCYFVEWTGTIDVAEIGTYYKELSNQPWLRPNMKALHDFRKAVLNLSHDDIYNTVNYYRETLSSIGDSRRSILVASDVTFGLSRIFAALADHLPGDFLVSQDVENSKNWLSLPLDYALPADR